MTSAPRHGRIKRDTTPVSESGLSRGNTAIPTPKVIIPIILIFVALYLLNVLKPDLLHFKYTPISWQWTIPSSLIGMAKACQNRLQINKYNRDFALAGGGGDIIPELTSATHNLPPHNFISRMRTALNGRDLSVAHVNLPITTLEETLEIGRCWEFAGSQGYLGIQLAEPIHVAYTTIYYPPLELLSGAHTQRAPRELILWGMVDNRTAAYLEGVMDSSQGQHPQLAPISKFSTPPTTTSSSSNQWFLSLATFAYRAQAYSSRSFTIYDSIRQIHNLTFSVVVLEVVSNWGAATTCLYRVGIHGNL